MAKTLKEEIKAIQDPHIKIVFGLIEKELSRIRNVPPVTEDLKQISTILNKITGNL